ncbi:MAG: undecaprenyl-phosphate alpha-N-acetylglucosaminyl 1-phosphate transferase [Alphaproteobacteria bacterium]|nr:undecaprenyl-phosphate alpha-N-acetylglucosaminyl 1-phosphate transferase [Alphaproteobacteria bacterium]|tara:strand:+ start:25810 stop:26910 length:1101 start_codon:yes stop_codon:yes gene_type:complete
MIAFILFVTGFVLVGCFMPIVARMAVRGGFVDAPGGRKQHDEPVPPVGGLLIVPVFLALYALAGIDWARDWSLIVGVIALLVIGAWDDRWQLGAAVRFAVQIIVAVMVVVFGLCRIDTLGNIFALGDFDLGWMAIPFSVAAVALLVNAINLMDGLDGLAGGQSFLIFALILIVAIVSGDNTWANACASAMGALGGFLMHNMRSPLLPRARVFLGDAGTLSLGLMLAWFSISAANDAALNLEAMSVAWFLAVPIMDECAQFYRRVREGRHPFSADRGHLHHYFIDAGFTPGQATVRILTISFALGGSSYAFAALGGPVIVLTLTWMAAILGHLYLTAHKPGFYAALFARFVPEGNDSDDCDNDEDDE